MGVKAKTNVYESAEVYALRVRVVRPGRTEHYRPGRPPLPALPPPRSGDLGCTLL